MKRFIALVAVVALLSGEAHAAYTGSPPLIVANGGTGTVTNTAHGLLLGQGTGPITAISPGATSGVPLIAQGGSSDPVYGTAVVAGGGTGAVTLTNHGVLLGQGTSALVATAVGTNGQMFLGATGADPGWQTMSADATLGTTGALTLATVNANVGSFTNTSITVNAKGLITAASNGTANAPTLVAYTSTLPMTMGTTNQETVVSNMGTPAAGIYNLPTASANLRKCLKDGTTNFATSNATVKAAGTIDGVAGATGIVMNQAKQELCFLSDGTNWFVE